MLIGRIRACEALTIVSTSIRNRIALLTEPIQKAPPVARINSSCILIYFLLPSTFRRACSVFFSYYMHIVAVSYSTMRVYRFSATTDVIWLSSWARLEGRM
jgi:hypothetical protein